MNDEKTQVLKYLVLLVIVVVPLFSLGLSNHGLWSPDEPRVAEIGREMALTGNWAVPTLNQKPFLEGPPLYYASVALTFKVFGVSDKVARIPSALFAFGAVLVVFFIANLLFGPRVALLSGLILATSGEYFRVAHWVIVDGALTFFVMGALYSFIMGYLSETNRKKLIYYILFYISCTLAFYTKGFIGIVIPGLSVLTFLVIERNFREIIKMRLWLGVLIFLAMTLPWFIALWHQAGTEYLNVFFIHNHLQRFLPGSLAEKISGGASGHHNPFYYYITELPNGFLPWSILLIPVLFHSFSKSGKSGVSNILLEKGTLFAKCWFFTGIIFLSIASTKRTLYLLPIFAPVAMLTATYIDSMLTSPQLLTKIAKICYLGFYCGFALYRPWPDTSLFLCQKNLPHECVRNPFSPDYRAFHIHDSSLYCRCKIFSTERPQEILDFNESLHHPRATLFSNGCHACPGYSQEFCPFLQADRGYSARRRTHLCLSAR